MPGIPAPRASRRRRRPAAMTRTSPKRRSARSTTARPSAWDASPVRKAASLYNLAVKGGLDSLLKMAFKAKYAKRRERVAVKRADRALAAGRPY